MLAATGTVSRSRRASARDVRALNNSIAANRPARLLSDRGDRERETTGKRWPSSPGWPALTLGGQIVNMRTILPRVPRASGNGRGTQAWLRQHITGQSLAIDGGLQR